MASTQNSVAPSSSNGTESTCVSPKAANSVRPRDQKLKNKIEQKVQQKSDTDLCAKKQQDHVSGAKAVCVPENLFVNKREGNLKRNNHIKNNKKEGKRASAESSESESTFSSAGSAPANKGGKRSNQKPNLARKSPQS